MEPVVSFVLPAYKGEFLQEAIQSLLSQTYENFELIVVNDCSPDDLDSIVESFRDSRISYYKNSQNHGAVDLINHWNVCIEKTRGEYVVIASDDDIYHPEYLSEMMLLVTKYPDVNLFHCRLRYIDKNKNVLQLSQPASEYESCADFVCQRLFWGRKQAAPEFLFRKKMWIDYKGLVNFPIAWYSDDATWNLFSQKGVAYSSKPLLSFRMSGKNLSSTDVRCHEKIEAMKKYVGWLENFIPTIECHSPDDVFEKELCLKNYKNIVYSHYQIYLPSLSCMEFMKEMKYIRSNRIFSLRTVMAMAVRKLMGL